MALTAVRAHADAGHDHGPDADRAPTPMGRNACQTAVSSCRSLRSASWRCAHWSRSRAHSPRTFELFGKVMMDPNAGGKVQPTIAGRIEPGPRGLPSLGPGGKQG